MTTKKPASPWAKTKPKAKPKTKAKTKKRKVAAEPVETDLPKDLTRSCNYCGQGSLYWGVIHTPKRDFWALMDADDQTHRCDAYFAATKPAPKPEPEPEPTPEPVVPEPESTASRWDRFVSKVFGDG